MSRQPSQGQSRTLTLPEQLEQLEQSITLTLQEIDSNFSRAHRIVTTSILPIVEKYAQHSNEVWEGSKFWKQFFEASANVSLSGYEEGANGEEGEGDGEEREGTSTELEAPSDHVEFEGGQAGAGAAVKGRQQQQQRGEDEDEEDDEEFSVDSPTQVTGLQTTPKLPSTTKKASNSNSNSNKGSAAGASFRSPSPRKYTGKNPRAVGDPSTPRQHLKNSASGNAASSPFQPESDYPPPSAQLSRANNNDPLMHRGVLDKNYRIQATPHTQRRKREQKQKEKEDTKNKASLLPWEDSPQSSPEMARPTLRSDLFSPAKLGVGAPRTPGVSVLTPARNKATNAAPLPTTSTGRQLFSPQNQNKTPAAAGQKENKTPLTTTNTTRASNIFSSPDGDEEDEDDIVSPPKTLQFHIPQSRLIQTPAREASKKIVEDLLLTAGAEGTDEIEGIDDPSLVDEPSPSLVRGLGGMGGGVEESF